MRDRVLTALIVAVITVSCLVYSTDARSQASTKPQSGVGSQASQPPAPSASQVQSQPGDPASALQFLGSYSAPSAIVSTETGHTSARPPSASAERRLQEIAGGRPWKNAHAARARQWLLDEIARSEHTPAEWFAIGGAALAEARYSSKRLAETNPASEWNRKLEAEALAARYPLLARQVLGNPPSAVGTAGTPANEGASTAPLKPASAMTAENVAGDTATLAAAERLPDSPEAFYRRARAALEVSQSAYRRASAEPEFEARLIALEALAAEEEDDEASALATYQAGLAKFPESEALHAGLGHLYRQRQEFDKARAELQQAARLDSSDAVVAFELGDIAERQGRPQQALDLLNQALALDPGLLVARWSRAKAYVAVKDDRSARADLEAASPADDTGELQWQLSRVYERLGLPTLAAQAEKRSEEQRRVNEGVGSRE